jgi:hypothetical protein
MLKLEFLLWLVAALVPGAAALRLCWPQAGLLRTLACAPVVSFGYCYGVGLSCSRLSLSPTTGVLVAVAALVVATAAVELRRGTRLPAWARLRERAQLRSAGALVSGGLLLTGIALGVLQWRRFQASMLVPIGWDAMHHGFFIAQISRYHTMSPAVVLASDPTGHDGGSTFYPLAFNLDAAVLHLTTGGLISTVMLASTAAIVGVLLPLGSFALARELDPRRPLAAGFAAITSVLPILLYQLVGTGRLTGALGVAMVPGLILLLFGQRTGLTWRTALLAMLGILGIIGLHTSEAPLAVISAAILVLVWAGQQGSRGAAWRWLLWVGGAGALTLAVLVLIEPSVVNLVHNRTGALLAPVDAGARRSLVAAFTAVGKVWVVLVIGLLATVSPRWREYRGTTLSLLVFGLLFYFVATGTRVLVPTLAIPWYSDSTRIGWDLAVLGAIPTAVGIVVIGGALGRLATPLMRFIAGAERPDAARRGRVEAWTPSLVAAAAGLLLIVGFALPSVGKEGLIAGQVAGPVNRDSVAAFDYLSTHVPPGQRVLDDLRTDGAMWMYVDHQATPLFGNSPLLGFAPHSWLQKLWLSRNLNLIDTDPCVRALMSQFSIGYVYVGDQRMFDGWAHFSSSAMSRSPDFTEVFDQGRAHVFRVVSRPEPGTCSRDVTVGVKWG